MAHSTEKLMITTSTQTDGTARVRVCNLVHIRRRTVCNGNWILCSDYRDETERLQICPSNCPHLNLGVKILLENVKACKRDNFLSFFLGLSLLKQFFVLTFCALLWEKPTVWLCWDGGALHVKYRSLVPEFLWPWPGSLRHFVLLTLAAVVFLTSSSSSSSTSLAMHPFVDSNTNTVRLTCQG